MLALRLGLALLVVSTQLCLSIWTEYDLVRPFPAWGSNQTTPFVKISGITKNGPSISEGSNFGTAVANVGDIDGDGISEIAVGAVGESIDYGAGIQPNAGALYLLFMHRNATVRDSVRITGLSNNGPPTYAGAQFGFSIAVVGDLDGDGIAELAVGAPGTITSAVYLLYLFPNGTVRQHVRIQGQYETGSTVPDDIILTDDVLGNNSSFVPNGPPIRYGSRFGTALATIGDFNNDGTPDLLASALDSSSGFSELYFMFLDRNGTVLNYTELSSGVNGLPTIPFFSGFGASLLLLPDLDNNSIPELAVGAPNMYVPGSLNVRSGQVYVLFLNSNGSVNSTTIITETSGEVASGDPSRRIPNTPYDLCATSITSIGDFNKDAYRQKHPSELSPEGRKPIADIVLGCPQTGSNGAPGRVFIVFLSQTDRQLVGVSELPSSKDQNLGLNLPSFGQFGAAVSGYNDVDKNGIREIVVGAPSDNSSGTSAGAIYILFPRRKRHHPPAFDWVKFYMLAAFLPGMCCCIVCWGIVGFCWYFRRIPDEVEIIVKNSGYKFDPQRPRAKYEKRKDRVYCAEYPV